MMFTRRRSRRDHTWAQENLSAYLDGEMPLDHKARLERHLAECAECRQSLHTLRQTVALLRRVPAVQPPVSFVLPPSAQRRQARYRQWQMAFGALRTAAVAVSVVLAVLLSADALLTSGLLTLPARPAEHVAAPTAQEGGYGAQKAAQATPQQTPTLAPSMTPPPPTAALALAKAPATLTPTAEIQAPVARMAAPQGAALPTPTGLPLTPTPEAPTFVEITPPSAPAVAAFPSAQGGAGMGGAGGSGGGAESGRGGAGAEGAPALAVGPAELKATPPFEPSTLQRGPVPSPSPEPTSTPTESAALAMAILPTATPPEPMSSPTPSVSTEGMASPTPAEIAFAPQPTQPTAEAPIERAEDRGAPSAALWPMWRAIRLGALGLAGFLLILLGGLLWLGQKRRV